MFELEEFPFRKANELAISRRTLIFGVAINDADYMITMIVDGKQRRCPYYQAWREMIRRVLSAENTVRYPTYADCTVCDEWLIFSNFRKWMTAQDWRGKQLDKDLRQLGNKLYSPETCSFVPCRINNLLLDQSKIRGKYYIGVYWDSSRNKFRSCCSDGRGKAIHLGSFDTEIKAHAAYLRKKSEVIMEAIEEYREGLHSEIIDTLNTKANQCINLAYYL